MKLDHLGTIIYFITERDCEIDKIDILYALNAHQCTECTLFVEDHDTMVTDLNRAVMAI